MSPKITVTRVILFIAGLSLGITISYVINNIQVSTLQEQLNSLSMLKLDIWESIRNAISLIALVISVFSYLVSRSQAKLAKESLSLNTFIKALEIWGSNEVREARKHIQDHFIDYTRDGDLEGEEISMSVKKGYQVKSVNRKVKELKNEDRKKFERVAVEADRISFMLFEIKELPKEFEKAYIEWIRDTFWTIWNRVAPHVDRERKRRRFVPYFEKLAYLSYLVDLKYKPDSEIIVLKQEAMEEAYRKFGVLWGQKT
jgi:hypothetical protein